jgi:hypothetical protein
MQYIQCSKDTNAFDEFKDVEYFLMEKKKNVVHGFSCYPAAWGVS